jgi:galactoside O-acetyltransferase
MFDMRRFESYGENCVVYDDPLILKPEMITLGNHVRIDGFCRLEGGKGLIIDDYVHVCSFASVLGGGLCRLGKYVALTQGVRVVTGTETHIGVMTACAPMELRRVKQTAVIFSDHSFAGVNAVIMPGVRLGRGAVAGAGSVITKDIPAWEIWAGNPAKKISERKPFEIKDGAIVYA